MSVFLFVSYKGGVQRIQGGVHRSHTIDTVLLVHVRVVSIVVVVAIVGVDVEHATGHATLIRCQIGC